MLALVGEMSVFATTRQAETLAEALITEGPFHHACLTTLCTLLMQSSAAVKCSFLGISNIW